MSRSAISQLKKNLADLQLYNSATLQLCNLATLLLAALIRFWQLDYHSVWFDEAVSLQWAGYDPSYTWQVTFQLLQDKHPPLYYLLLHYWQQLWGLWGLAQSDIALRSLGSLLGVLTVWGTERLATRANGPATGFLAGLLVAVCPVLVWYSQELRMFQPATTALVWAAYFQLRAWQTSNRLSRWLSWAGFILTLTAALYTYLFSAFLLPAAGISLFILWIANQQESCRDTLGKFSEGIIALAAVTALYLPLAYNAWIVNATESSPGQAFENFFDNLHRLLQIFTIWRVEWTELWITSALLLLGILALVGLFIHRLQKKEDAAYSVLIWLGIPLLVANILLSRSGSIFREDRYLLFLAPFVLWAIARGAVILGQRWRGMSWISGFLAFLILTMALPRLWSPVMHRENWRAAAEHVMDYERKSDALPSAIVAHVDYTHQPIKWYLQPHFTHEELPLFFPYGGQLTPDQVETVIAPPLLGIVEYGAATLWLTQSHLEGVDDARLVEGWLNQRFPLVTELYPAGIKLSGYALQSRFDTLPVLDDGIASYPATQLVPGLTLAACEIINPRLSAQDSQMHPPSGWVHVRLWWQATGSIADDYIASVQMIGVEGIWGDRLYRANEALRRWPTSSWQPGQIIRDEVDVNLNPVTPDNIYPIIVGVRDNGDNAVGASVECGEVEIY